jgi:chorismate mutase
MLAVRASWVALALVVLTMSVRVASGQERIQPMPPNRTHEVMIQDLQLSDLRTTLDNLDAALIRLLAERFRTTQKIGEYKRRHGLPARDEAREKLQLQRAREMASSAGLDPELAQRVFRVIFDAVVENHQRLLREKPRGETVVP